MEIALLVTATTAKARRASRRTRLPSKSPARKSTTAAANASSVASTQWKGRRKERVASPGAAASGLAEVLRPP